MTATQHFDVVVLGRGLGAVAAGALLAKSGFRVLVVGQGAGAARYSFEDHALARRTFVLATTESPVLLQIQRELAITQLVRRRLTPESTIFHWYRTANLLAADADRVALENAVARAYGLPVRLVADYYRQLSDDARATDTAFEQIGAMPAVGYWARRRVAALLKTCPQFNTRVERDLHHQLGAYGQVLVRSAQQLSSVYPQRSAMAARRLHGFWMRGCHTMEHGEDGLLEIFCDRIRAQGGDVRLGERATFISGSGRRLSQLGFGDAQIQVGFDALVTSNSALALRDVLPQNMAQLLSSATQQVPTAERFVLSLVVQSSSVPCRVPHAAFLESADSELGTLFIQRESGRVAGTTLLAVEAHLERGVLPRMRERMLDALARVLPYVKEGMQLMDSPHDGRPLFDYRRGERVPVDRVTFRSGGAEVDAEQMLPLYYPNADEGADGFVQFAAQTPFDNVWQCNEQILPALGQEGLWFAAVSIAQTIRKRDPSKERVRKLLWGKVEAR
jgi:phytoene dehydrogenase-like protein